jgi:hypothetical protein
VDVKQYGATGDGVADDTLAMQTALNGGRRTVVIPAGTYKISNTLKLDSGTTIRADPKAIVRLADHAGNDVGLFLLTNRDFAAGNTDITVDGGIWDGNNEHNARGEPDRMPCYTGVALNFVNVRHLTLRNLTVRNPDAYAIRACKLSDFTMENIGFDFRVTRPNQDGVHLNGFCARGVIRNLRALSRYATNDDMVALNADDGSGAEYVFQQGMVSGPIRDILVERLRAESAFTFVRLLSHRELIENVTIRDVVGGCRFYAVNMDRWRFPAGGGNIRNVTLRDFTIRKMPDNFSKQARPGERPLIHIQSAVQGFRIENFHRQPDDEQTARSLVVDNGQPNQLRLEGLTTEQVAELKAPSPSVTPATLSAQAGKDLRALQTNEPGQIILPKGGFSLLAINPVQAANIHVYQADADWIPIRWEPARIVKGSALDFSSFLEAPAGKFGASEIRNAQFVFKNAPDKPLRIYGAVVSHALPFLDKPQCEQLADYLAACGYNGVRLHNYNFARDVMKEVGSTEFTPRALDQLDYLFFCLKQRGIYFTFPLNAWGFFKAGDAKDIPEFRERAFRFESNGLLPISADLQQWFKDYSRRLLGHINPYTGMALKDDPALLSLELANENSLLAVLGQYPELVPIYRNRCRSGMQAKLGHDPNPDEVEKELPGYVLKLQEQFYLTMKDFLREMGVKQPLTDSNFRDNLAYAIPRSQQDYVDVHAYWALYHNLYGDKVSGEPAYQQTWANPNPVNWGTLPLPAPCRLFDKPFMNSEFNSCYPTPFWIFSGPIEATTAGLQGWNGVFRCGLAAQPAKFFTQSPVRRIETAPNPLVMFSERIGSMLFAQGEVSPLPVKVPLVVTPAYLLAKLDLTGGPKCPPSYTRLSFLYQLGTILLDGREQLEGYPCLVAPADMELPASLSGKKILPTDATLAARLKEALPTQGAAPLTTPQFDLTTGSAQIVTPRSETFLFPAEAGGAEGQSIRVSGNQTVSVCFAGSLDSRSLSESNRVLALYLTDLKNTDTEIEFQTKPKDSVIVRNPGKLPLLVRQGKIEMHYKAKDRPLPQIWALKYDGSRSEKIDPRRTPGGFSFEARAVTNPETFSAFEITWKVAP